jgi:hypothetical protein
MIRPIVRTLVLALFLLPAALAAGMPTAQVIAETAQGLSTVVLVSAVNFMIVFTGTLYLLHRRTIPHRQAAEQLGLGYNFYKSLREYVHKARKHGLHDDHITLGLVEGGWDRETVENYIKFHAHKH